jgi:hypothetical protein
MGCEDRFLSSLQAKEQAKEHFMEWVVPLKQYHSTKMLLLLGCILQDARPANVLWLVKRDGVCITHNHNW